MVPLHFGKTACGANDNCAVWNPKLLAQGQPPLLSGAHDSIDRQTIDENLHLSGWYISFFNHEVCHRL